MSLADALRARPDQPPRCRTCAVLRLLDDTDPEGAAALRDALDSDDFSHGQIARVLIEHGISITRASVAAHRRRECASASRRAETS